MFYTLEDNTHAPNPPSAFFLLLSIKIPLCPIYRSHMLLQPQAPLPPAPLTLNWNTVTNKAPFLEALQIPGVS